MSKRHLVILFLNNLPEFRSPLSLINPGSRCVCRIVGKYVLMPFSSNLIAGSTSFECSVSTAGGDGISDKFIIIYLL